MNATYGLIFLAATVILLGIAAVGLVIHITRTMRTMDSMLDRAIDGDFSEKMFTEAKLSRLETKLYRYLSAGKTAQNQIVSERNAVKMLVSDISHQTKTPISNILLYTQLLRETQGPEEHTKELLCHITEQTEKLNFLIQSLVKVSRLENGIVAVTPAKNNVKQLLERIDFRAAAQKKEICLIVEKDVDAAAEFDLKWTVEAVSNLIDNAIKYTPCGGTVRVSVKEYEMFVRIDVADTGKGICEADTAKIFTRFYRAQEVKEEKGVGIGLYLTREILSKEGGYIRVASEVGKGSVFSVFLPKASNLSKL